jgi:hypothetical protein
MATDAGGSENDDSDADSDDDSMKKTKRSRAGPAKSAAKVPAKPSVRALCAHS